MYVVAGATGNTGRVVAESLLQAGQKVRVLGRGEEKLKPFLNHGAELFTLDMANASELSSALSGATAAYMLIPPDYSQQDFIAYMSEVADSITAAIQSSGVGNIVFLSSVGAQHPDGTGPIKGLHHAEKKLALLQGVNILSLRATFFMENHFSAMEPLKQFGIIASLMEPTVEMPMIATRDIGNYVAKRMMNLDFHGMEYQELLGPKDYTMTEVASAIGKAIDKPNLPYNQIDEGTVRAAMSGMGASNSIIDLYMEMNRAFNSGLVKGIEPRDEENTTPTTIEEFAEVFAMVYKGVV